MVTPEDITGIEVFAMLDADEHEHLARVAADVGLVAGEYAANAGDDRALFAVLDGRIEAVKAVDGVDRVVGERLPGDVFGEVPIVLGTVFPVGFRAAVASRVLRIEPAAYHAIAAADPIVAKSIGALASLRMAGPRGLQGLAAEPPPPTGDPRRAAPRSRVRAAAPLPRPQPDQLPVAAAGRTPTRPGNGTDRCRTRATAR